MNGISTGGPLADFYEMHEWQLPMSYAEIVNDRDVSVLRTSRVG